MIDTTLASDNSSHFRKNIAKFTYSPPGKAFEKQKQLRIKETRDKQNKETRMSN